MRQLKKFILVSTALMVTFGIMAQAAGADTVSDEQRFVQMINADRAANGLGALTWLPQIVDTSRSHSAEMAQAGNIFHTANLGAIPGAWVLLGENVGMGGSVDALHQAFMNSPHHRENILGSYDKVGIGIVMGGSDGQTIFVTEQFWKSAPVPAVRARIVHRRFVRRRRIVRRRFVRRHVVRRVVRRR